MYVEQGGGFEEWDSYWAFSGKERSNWSNWFGGCRFAFGIAIAVNAEFCAAHTRRFGFIAFHSAEFTCE
jgi:hypothetical protein